MLLAFGLASAAALRQGAAHWPRSIVKMSSVDDLSRCTVVELKEKLRAAGLPISGRKAELVERLGTSSAAPPQAPAPSGNSAGAASAYPPISIEACKS